MRFLYLLSLVVFLPGIASASLEFTSTRLDLKPAAGTKFVDAEFPFRNSGKDTVKVLDVISSCGCTVPALAKKDYAPGEAGVLHARFEIGDRQGLQSKALTVRTDAGDHSLQLVVDLPQRLVIEPRLVVFGPKDTGDKTLKLSFRADAPVTNVVLNGETPPFVATLATDKAGSDYTVTIKLAPNTTDDHRVTILVRSKGASGIDYTDAFYLRYAP